MQAESRRSYARRDFNETLDLVDELVREEPEDTRYHEMRAAVRVDNKNFAAALEDYEKALSSTAGMHLFLTPLAGGELCRCSATKWRGAFLQPC